VKTTEYIDLKIARNGHLLQSARNILSCIKAGRRRTASWVTLTNRTSRSAKPLFSLKYV